LLRSSGTRAAASATKATREPVSSRQGKKPKGGKLGKRDKESNAEISALRAAIERVVSHFKSWRIFHSDYRRPYSTYRDAYDAARGLFFFSTTW
jgi:hypothetical protein